MVLIARLLKFALVMTLSPFIFLIGIREAEADTVETAVAVGTAEAEEAGTTRAVTATRR